MAKFKFYLEKEKSEEELILNYDNETSELRHDNGDVVVPQDEFKNFKPFFKMDEGKRNLTRIKIQLGLKCNYSCEYCSQRFIPRNPDDDYKHEDEDEKTAEEISIFIKRFDKVTIGESIHFEMWGGEPFLYFPKMKLITKQLHEKYPNATFSVITNGSLLNQEIIDFIQKYKFGVAISHDGVGQKTRGPDPLEDTEKKKWLFKLRNLLVPEKRFSVSSMIHKDNDSRAEVQRWIRNNFGMVSISEGGTVDAYDEGGASMSWKTNEEHIAYRRKAFREIMNKSVDQFVIKDTKIKDFISSLKQQRPSSSLLQKCGMDIPDIMAVDLNGNVTTCQNVTVSSENPAGISHHIGHMDDTENVNIKTGTHWSDREECPKCPVLHLCQGSCLFLSSGSEEWKLSCENAYSDNVVWLVAALYELTGFILYKIEGPHPVYRQDIFGFEAKKSEYV
jgi:uncharacterized protein